MRSGMLEKWSTLSWSRTGILMNPEVCVGVQHAGVVLTGSWSAGFGFVQFASQEDVFKSLDWEDLPEFMDSATGKMYAFSDLRHTTPHITLPSPPCITRHHRRLLTEVNPFTSFPIIA